MADEAAVIDAGTVAETPTVTESAPVSTETPAVSAETPVTPSALDPKDPMAALQAAMDAQLGKDEPVPEGTVIDPGAQSQIPPEFAQALQISDFVKEPAHVEQAIRAADEVWKVASGQAPASGLLEGMRAANPDGFRAVIGDLIPYIEQVTGRAFTDKPNTPPDPNQARMDAIEQRFAAQERERQDGIWNQQVTKARDAAMTFLTSKTKGTFAEGQEAYLLQQAGAKSGIPQEQMVEMLLSGKTEKLEAAYRAVQKDETARLRAYNANLVKQHNALKNSVPASKGAPVGASTTTNGVPARKAGESDVDYGVRVWRSIK